MSPVSRLYLSLLAVLPAPAVAPAAAPEFERDVLPILTNQCLNCHGGLRQRNGLDLRTVGGVTKGGKSGPAVVSGKPDDSLLWKRVVADEMPDALLKLSAAEKKTLRDWIAAGLPRSPNWNRAAVPTPAEPSDPAAVAAAVDQAIDTRLASAEFAPAEPSSDAEFLRRAYLDLTGRIPTAEKAAGFLDGTDVNKRAKLVDELLASPDYGRHQALTWRKYLVPRETKLAAPEQAELEKWLADGFNAGRGWDKTVADGFNAGRGWDKTVADLLTAEGPVTGTPAAAFLYANQGMNRFQPTAAAATARAFLGLNLTCAECHDHPTRDWKRTDFWGLAAFFARAEFAKPKKDKAAPPPPKGVIELVLGEPPVPPNKVKRGAGVIDITDQDRKVFGEARAKFLGGAEPELSVTEPYRPVLAAWVASAENPYFAKAAANRVWAQLLGRGFIDPVDDLDPANPPSHPAALDLLAKGFAAAGFDFKYLVRCVTLTKAYGRSAVPADGNRDRDPLFARVRVKVMPPEVLFDSLEVACGPLGDPGATPLREAFAKAFDVEDPDARPTDYLHGIPQALRLMNAEVLAAAGPAADRLARGRTAAEVIDRLYLTALSRRPTAAERKRMTEYVAGSGTPATGYRDVFWALLNGSEFVLVP